MTDRTVFVAGATGAVGREVVRLASARGLRVRAMGRNAETLASLDGAAERVVADALEPSQLASALAGVQLVFSSLGASVRPDPRAGSRSYLAIDTPANLNLVDAAARANVDRFVYVSLALADELPDLAYVQAHEQVVGALERSGLCYTILRPTGFFSAFASILDLARRGSVPCLGDPQVRTNPISDIDLASVAVDELTIADRISRERALGGPEVLTRRQIIEAAFRALGHPTRIRRVPDWLVRIALPFVGMRNPRLAEITRFYLAVSNRDCIAPPHGERRIAEYFHQLAHS